MAVGQVSRPPTFRMIHGVALPGSLRDTCGNWQQDCEVPQNFTCIARSRFLDSRRKEIESGEGIDWATAEALGLLFAAA